MSQFTAYYGIFIQSKEPTDEFISDCIRELKPVCNSSIKRVFDDNGNGIRMYFEDTKTVATVLKRKELLISGTEYGMCPLVTYLTLHKVVPVTEHDMERSLSGKLQRYLGPVLKINELPRPTDPSVLSANWRVIIEIPELEALKVSQNFKKKNKNSSNEKNIEFFYIEDGLKFSFFCHKCQKDGHISQKCKMPFKRRTEKTNKPSCKNTRSNTSFQKDAVASTSAAASEPEASTSAAASNAEAGTSAAASDSVAGTSAASNNNIRGQTSSNTTGQPKRKASSTSIKRPSKKRSKDVRNTLRAHSFRQPISRMPSGNTLSSITAERESRTPCRRNSAIAKIEILLNSRTEECIRKAGGTHRLSHPQLENFFNHVKGKKDIHRILKMHTKMHKVSEKAVKEQLNEIVRLYHVSKLPETKEDKVLIRWLECLIERLYKKHR